MNPQAALCPATEQGTHALLIHSLKQQILKKSDTMSKNKSVKQQARQAREARQARRVVNGIFIALILLMVLSLVAYYLFTK